VAFFRSQSRKAAKKNAAFNLWKSHPNHYPAHPLNPQNRVQTISPLLVPLKKAPGASSLSAFAFFQGTRSQAQK
jgi:hypothetical protein